MVKKENEPSIEGETSTAETAQERLAGELEDLAREVRASGAWRSLFPVVEEKLTAISQEAGKVFRAEVIGFEKSLRDRDIKEGDAFGPSFGQSRMLYRIVKTPENLGSGYGEIEVQEVQGVDNGKQTPNAPVKKVTIEQLYREGLDLIHFN